MNLDWLPDDGGTGHMPPSEAVIDFWKKAKDKTNFKKVIEIGFNAGHSSCILLELFDDVEILSFDIGQFEITHTNGKLVKEKYVDRFNLKIKDSLKITPEEINGYDIMFIDGGHDYEIVSKDIDLFMKSDINYVILDDLNHPGVSKAYSELDGLDTILKYKYRAVLPSWMRNTGKSPVMVPIEILKKK